MDYTLFLQIVQELQAIGIQPLEYTPTESEFNAAPTDFPFQFPTKSQLLQALRIIQKYGLPINILMPNSNQSDDSYQ